MTKLLKPLALFAIIGALAACESHSGMEKDGKMMKDDAMMKDGEMMKDDAMMKDGDMMKDDAMMKKG